MTAPTPSPRYTSPPLQTQAPAKINLTFEILGRRDDSFHDLASVAHTLDLADTVRLVSLSRTSTRERSTAPPPPLLADPNRPPAAP